jgi:hypothetical protein
MPSLAKPGVSVFASTTARPALGRLFTDMLALHLLITTVPRTADDATRLYASPPSPRTPDPDRPLPQDAQKEIQYVHVIEVLKDTTPDLDYWLGMDLTRQNYNPRDKVRKRMKRRHKQSRSQRWAAFDISADGLGLKNAFEQHAKPMPGLGQMHIAKQFPFGRRA